MSTILDSCRILYNKTLGLRKDTYETSKKSLSFYDTNKYLPIWKEEIPELKIPHSQTLQDVQKRVDLAFQSFFRRVKNKEKEVGFPRFKGQGRYDSFTYTQSGYSLNKSSIKLSKIGSVRIKLHRELEGTIKRITITKSNSGKWYICFMVEIPNKSTKKVRKPKAVGIDVGLTSFATLSNNTKIESPKFLKKSKDKLSILERKRDKHNKGTEQRKKYNKKISKVYEKITNQRSNFLHQTSRKLINEFDVICVEDLKIQKMQSNAFRNINKGINDSGWGIFFNQIAYKAEEAGKQIIKVNPRNTSQQCSQCGAIVEKDLSERTHHCPFCNLEIDRDLNASLNILRLGAQSLGLVKS